MNSCMDLRRAPWGVPRQRWTDAMAITNSCKCSKFQINVLQLHFTNFRQASMEEEHEDEQDEDEDALRKAFEDF